MARTFKVLSLLLTYPDEAIVDAAPAMAEALETDPLLKGHQRKAVGELISELASRDLYDLQERYVTLFDRTRSLSLHLFEHIHGESRDRGQALVDLQKLYDSHGLVVAANELPDFLPL
ncbi:MAG: nitrate reductase molybdenum cofactor assembly chaperone, partial [Rhodospirillaceae bacterium]|nr:nitrate reductase molybdenum cofactor assembly chaperone [Rhodospirillaceae bacterium]